MKLKQITLLIFAFTLLLTSTAMAANIADFTIRNADFVEKFKYSIDIYAVSTQDDFGVGSSTIALEFNDAVLSNYKLSNENALFHDNSDYAAMSIVIDPGSTGDTNRIALTITPTSGTGATLPGSDTRLATITFDIDPTSYKTETSEIMALLGLSSVVSLPDSGVVVLDWAGLVDFADNSMICYPDISGTPDTTAEVGFLYDFTPTTVDVCDTIPDEGPLTFTIENQPSWTTFDTGTGRLYGTPAFGEIANYSAIRITVEDGYEDSIALTDFDIDVSCPPPPAISGTPAISIVSGTAYDFTPTVTDGCGTLTFSITNPPAWADFSFDTGTGRMTGTPTLAEVGTTTGIVITVEDENSNMDTLAAFDIEVTASCTSPSLSGTPAITVTVGSLYSFTPTVSNGCSPLSYTIANQPAWASFDVNTGELSGTPSAGDEGSYNAIVITVTDDLSNTDSLTAFNLQVTAAAVGGGGGGGGGGCFISNLLAH